MLKKIFFLLLSAAVFMACQKTPAEKMIGKWHGTAWLVKGQPTGFDPSVIHFEFQKNNRYATSFGIQNEKGSYQVIDNTFYADSDYKTERSKKKVPILKMTQDTMVWLMDSVQQEGILYLVRD